MANELRSVLVALPDLFSKLAMSYYALLNRFQPKIDKLEIV